MKKRPFTMLTLLASLAIVLALGPFRPAAAVADPLLTLNINLASEPITLDPALAFDTTAGSVIEQLFIGLVDLDDDTAEVHPELASSWTVSPDGTIYTFSLRSDVYWTDGNPVTAGDVRYGILRSLNPATGSSYAYSLYVIKNAQAYNQGGITDPSLVGVSVLDATHLQITLEYPATYALSIFSLWAARPMPQAAIEAHPTDWTSPANIVTNGAYRLTEWAHNDHILLDKNPTYYDAANVQIEQVKMWMVADADAAWSMYLNGQLETAAIPPSVNLNEIFPEELHILPSACTQYYGFSTSQPPFDNPLVRKAFSAATNRIGLIQDVLGGGAIQPALTFTPPGVFGHVDGYAEGVGIPYNPVQARQWLAQAGYPDGAGLPPITLWSNDSPGPQANAEYIRDSWSATLGVSVTLQSMDWATYLAQYRNGQMQIWRMGWGMDYPDANNFLRDGLSRSALGGWNNPTYEGLLDQASNSQDPVARAAFYKQAEEILVESDAVVIPLYYFEIRNATKPYLQRTFSAGGSFDISTWQITIVSSEITTGGGSLTSYSGDTTIQVPAGAFSESVVLTENPAYGEQPGGNLNGIEHVFDLAAVYSGSGLPAQPTPGQTYTISVQYTDAETGPTIEDTLALYTWDGSQWVKEPSSTVDTLTNRVTATPGHFSRWAVLGETHRLYLPLILKIY